MGTTSEPTQYVDAFDGGRRLDAEGCARRFAAVTGGQRLDPATLAPVGSRAILARMLANLGAIARQKRDRDLEGWVLRLRSAVPSLAPAERRDLATALATAGRFDEAAAVFEALADSLGLPEHHEIRRQSRLLRARLN